MNATNIASATVELITSSFKVRRTHALYRPFRIVKWKPKKLQVRSIGFTVSTINCTAIINHLFRLNKTKNKRNAQSKHSHSRPYLHCFVFDETAVFMQDIDPCAG